MVNAKSLVTVSEGMETEVLEGTVVVVLLAVDVDDAPEIELEVDAEQEPSKRAPAKVSKTLELMFFMGEPPLGLP